LPAWLREKAERNGERRAVEVFGEACSYAGLDRLADRIGGGLAALGIQPGAPVAVMMNTTLAAVGVWFGLVRAGALEIPVNPASRGASLWHVLHHSAAQAVILEESQLAALADVIDRLPDLRLVVVQGAEASGKALPVEVAYFESLPPSPSEWEHEATGTDPCVVLYTSGTSGPPKGVVLSHLACLNLARTISRSMGYGAQDVLFNGYPLVHGSGRYAGVLTAMESDARLVMSRFSAGGFWDLCRAQGITSFTYVGSVISMLWKQPARSDDADNPVRVGRGAGAPAVILEPFEQRFGVSLYEVYGMTEAQTAAENLPSRRRLGSCGFPNSNFDIAIIDGDDNRVEPRVHGEIVIRPRRPEVMMQGYFRQPEETLRAFRNLWFHTGDRGWMDDDGYLYFVDRMKDAIRRRGENVSAWELESVINAYAGVLECAAYGVASELGEDEVMIAVVPKPEMKIDPDALVKHCAGNMPTFAVPRFVRFMNELPKTATQRVQKYLLREQGVTLDTWERPA
jgi:crotonobetaine/carnitine-CoA ligase